MMKRIMTTIAILATLTLTGCSLNNELSPFIPVEAAGNSETSAVPEVEEPTNSTSEVENETSVNTSEPVESTTSTTSSTESKPEEKPVESTSTTVEKPVASTSTVESKPVSSTTSSKVEVPVSSSTSKVEKPASSSTTTSSKPVASTTTSSSTSKVEKPASSSTTSKPSTPVSSSTTPVSTSKPVEKPVHNCSTDGHIWEVTTTTTEPKWCREIHMVHDFGFDATLASKYFNINAGEAYKVFKKTCKEKGVNGICGGATIEVEVWGTETYEIKKCTECGLIIDSSAICTINPIGEWRYIDGQNPMVSANNNYNFNTLFYDPYNVPQVVIDNIRIYRG